MKGEVQELNEKVQAKGFLLEDILNEIGKVIVGQKYMVERILIGLFTRGHILVEGVPGLAKTLTIRTLSDILDIQFQRIQFTPDLLPADVIGTLIYDQSSNSFKIQKGPVFANLILADEINRAPAKVQSALLQAMEEKEVTIGKSTYTLDKPFLVMSTQNPIEQEGTYPLPEAQIDRFLLKLNIDYPAREEELEILNRMSGKDSPKVDKLLKPQEILEIQELVDSIYVDDKLREYIVDIVFATREPKKYGLDELEEQIDFGASPRGTIGLIKAARAHAFLRRRGYVIPEDIKAIGRDVLRHRIILSYEAEAIGVTVEDIIDNIINTIEVP